jgi:hypothetical protein
MAMPTLFGDPSGLREQDGLRLPSWPPGLFFSCLGRGARRLFRPDSTSLSTGVETGYRGSPDSKSNDNACAKCAARECRQDQNHDHPSRQENNHPQIPLSISANRHEMASSAFSRAFAYCSFLAASLILVRFRASSASLGAASFCHSSGGLLGNLGRPPR